MTSGSAALAMHSQPTTILRVAAAWGTTVLAVKTLRVGDSAAFGYGPDALLPQPDGLQMAPIPIRAVDTGWQIDAYGSTGGLLRRSARDENPANLVEPVHIVPGDWGLLQYGLLSVFFQFAEAPPPLSQPRRRDWLLRIAFAGSVLVHVAALGALARLGGPAISTGPIDLLNAQQIWARFGLYSWIDDKGPTGKNGAPARGKLQSASPSEPSPESVEELKRALFAVPSVGGVSSIRGGGAVGAAAAGGRKVMLTSGGGTVVGGLSMDTADGVAQGHWEALSACCQAEGAVRGELPRGVDILVGVGPDGAVQTTEIRGAGGAAPVAFESCMMREIRTWRFPTGSARSEIRYSFRLAAVGR